MYIGHVRRIPGGLLGQCLDDFGLFPAPPGLPELHEVVVEQPGDPDAVAANRGIEQFLLQPEHVVLVGRHGS
jgi:hypothetical protein